MGLSLADRVLLVAVYYWTNLTLRQVVLLVGISKSAAGRVVDYLAPLLALAPVTRRHSPDTVLIVDGTLVLTHDRSVSASSKNYRYSVNMQVVIDANTRLVVVGDPAPGNRNDCHAHTGSGVDEQCRGATVMADGRYQGNPEVIMPCRKPREGQPPLPQCKEELNTVQKSVRARVEHALAHRKSLEHPAQRPPQTRRRLARHPRHRPDAQPGHHRLNGHWRQTAPLSPPCPTNTLDHYGGLSNERCNSG
ncbi:hypothetical protein GCM10011609_88210 [Lentzea pudingi]|uniref:DDE superfamily endonuclease n=1 Tax=Lentzea pudingi TaxID=1789439 RepID=A0ABQ2IUV8_9PSEU|nr:hypothetical protein GCM10011609_88210 [Lentzea pudingi]